MRPFPADFIKSLRSILPGQEYLRLVDSLSEGVSPVSVRFNPFKITEKPGGKEVPWCRYGRYLDERPAFSLDPMFHGGTYYVQEAASMFVEHLLREATSDRVEGLTVLDLCAAPGGKTTLLSTLVGADGLVVANETIYSRATVLADNVRKWGIGNVVVTNNDPSHFGVLEHSFDAVLIDAPCSGEGMFRKSDEAIEGWSEDNVKLCAARQRRIIADVWNSLKPGGVLIYSTCTFNMAENEDNIGWLIDHYDCDVVDITTDESWGIVRGRVGGVNTFRFFPHLVRSEGFFAAVVTKGDGRLRPKNFKPRHTPFSDVDRKTVQEAKKWVSQPEYMHFAKIGDRVFGYYEKTFGRVKYFAENLTAIYSGVEMGQPYNYRLKPEHALALFHGLRDGATPETELSEQEALAYLRKQDIDASRFAEGINLASFSGLPLGWIKRIGARTNNMYPKELRILK